MIDIDFIRRRRKFIFQYETKRARARHKKYRFLYRIKYRLGGNRSLAYKMKYETAILRFINKVLENK